MDNKEILEEMIKNLEVEENNLHTSITMFYEDMRNCRNYKAVLQDMLKKIK